MARPPIAGGRKAVTTLLSNPSMNRIEELRNQRRDATGKYVSTGAIVRELVDFALDFKEPIERLVKAQ